MGGIKVEMRGIGVKMRGIRKEMQGIRVGMQEIRSRMRRIGVEMCRGMKINGNLQIYKSIVVTFWYEKQLKKLI